MINVQYSRDGGLSRALCCGFSIFLSPRRVHFLVEFDDRRTTLPIQYTEITTHIDVHTSFPFFSRFSTPIRLEGPNDCKFSFHEFTSREGNEKIIRKAYSERTVYCIITNRKIACVDIRRTTQFINMRTATSLVDGRSQTDSCRARSSALKRHATWAGRRERDAIVAVQPLILAAGNRPAREADLAHP